MSKRPHPSAHDVARLAGVSQAAVSRAFTPGASIAEVTREKVIRAAESLGYRPNLLARSLIKGQSGIVGVVIGNALNPFFTAALDALSARLSQVDKHILMFTARGSTHADEQVEDLLKYRVDALLLMAATLSPQLAERCHNEKIPVIFFNRRTARAGHFASVVGNSRDGVRQIAGHLLEQGYRRIAMIAGFRKSSTGRERETAFAAYLSERGLPPPETAVGQFQREGAMRAARLLLSRKDRPDAIFCANDYMAFAAIEVARYEFGLEIGRDIGIAGFDDVEQASWPSFDLTTYSLPVDAMIEQVVRILLCEPGAWQPTNTVVDGMLKCRGSTLRDRN